jgi:hypothetical protein
MGWTSTHATNYKNGKVDKKAECDKLFTQSEHYWNDGDYSPKFTVLKSAVVGSTYYAAVERVNNKENTRIVYGVVCLTSVDNKDYFNFSYKELDETEGPYEYDCPKSILKLLSPTDSEYALNWRKQCIEKANSKTTKSSALKKIDFGAKVKVKTKNGNEYTVIKMKPNHQFKQYWWMVEGSTSYLPKSYIDSYELIAE